MDLTPFGPYALNVRTNISSYEPLARLIRAYYGRNADLVRQYISNVCEMFADSISVNSMGGWQPN